MDLLDVTLLHITQWVQKEVESLEEGVEINSKVAKRLDRFKKLLD